MAKETTPDPDFITFSEAHALYGGMKRYVMTEFKNLKAKHKNWQEILPMLKGAIQNQIDWRAEKKAAGEWVPDWKLFSKYIDESYFEVEFPLAKKTEVKTDKIPYF